MVISFLWHLIYGVVVVVVQAIVTRNIGARGRTAFFANAFSIVVFSGMMGLLAQERNAALTTFLCAFIGALIGWGWRERDGRSPAPHSFAEHPHHTNRPSQINPAHAQPVLVVHSDDLLGQNVDKRI